MSVSQKVNEEEEDADVRPPTRRRKKSGQSWKFFPCMKGCGLSLFFILCFWALSKICGPRGNEIFRLEVLPLLLPQIWVRKANSSEMEDHLFHTRGKDKTNLYDYLTHFPGQMSIKSSSTLEVQVFFNSCERGYFIKAALGAQRREMHRWLLMEHEAVTKFY